MPMTRIALRDGFGVASCETVGATPYAPIYVSIPPRPVQAGGSVPSGCDAVLPPHALVDGPAGAEIIQAVAPGDSTRETGGDYDQATLLIEAGTRLRADRIGLLAAAEVEDVAVRVPRVALDGIVGPASSMIAAWLTEAGCAVGRSSFPEDLSHSADTTDLVILLCEPGHAGSVPHAAAIGKTGRLIAHGLAMRPGEAIACGMVSGADAPCPIFVVPDRLEEALAAWLLLIRPVVTRLAGATGRPQTETRLLSRKIVSAPGVTDLVLLRREAARVASAWKPIATGDLPWSALACAEAFCFVPPESEGFQAGTSLEATLLR